MNSSSRVLEGVEKKRRERGSEPIRTCEDEERVVARRREALSELRAADDEGPLECILHQALN